MFNVLLPLIQLIMWVTFFLWEDAKIKYGTSLRPRRNYTQGKKWLVFLDRWLSVVTYVNSPKHEVFLLSNKELIKHTSDVKLLRSIAGFITMKWTNELVKGCQISRATYCPKL